MQTLWHLPLEEYNERYTGQLRHWMGAAFAKAKEALTNNSGQDEFAVETVYGERGAGSIKTGVVLDAGQRVRWATEQVKRLTRVIESGTLKSGDHIHLDDFWHPGIDGLWYALSLHDVNVTVSAFCWAQSVDKHDFTHQMGWWMRDIERSHGKRIHQVFVADDQLNELLVAGGLPAQNVYTVGLPFDSRSILDVHYGLGQRPFWLPEQKARKVVFSSRLDHEKQPLQFCQMAQRFKETGDSTEFVICSGSSEIRSNDPWTAKTIQKLATAGVITLKLGLTKNQYYEELASARVQFNSALQDWVSFTLLEAITFGCWPIYPMYRSFPAALWHEPAFMYRPNDVDDACEMVKFALDEDRFYTDEAIKARQNLILYHHDNAIGRMIFQMPLGQSGARVDITDNKAYPLPGWKAWRQKFAQGSSQPPAPPPADSTVPAT